MTHEELVNAVVARVANDKAGFIECYQITEEEYALALECAQNIDTEKGYEAYAKLEMSVEKRKGDCNILADMAADFAWDERLSEAVDAIHKRTGYYEEHKSLYPVSYED